MGIIGSRKKLKIISFLISALVLIFCFASCKSENRDIDITVLSLSNGEGTVIRTDDKTIIIDTGNISGGEYISDILKKDGVSEIDAVVLSHYDSEHIGGSVDLIRNFYIKKVYIPKYAPADESFDSLFNAIDETSTDYCEVDGSVSFGVGNISLTLNSGDKKEYNDSDSYSIITKLISGKDTLLFTSDATEERINEYLLRNEGAISLLSANDFRSSKRLIDSLSPKHIIINSQNISPEFEEYAKTNEISYYSNSNEIRLVIDKNTINFVQ